jgi:hypothetical protein
MPEARAVRIFWGGDDAQTVFLSEAEFESLRASLTGSRGARFECFDFDAGHGCRLLIRLGDIRAVRYDPLESE